MVQPDFDYQVCTLVQNGYPELAGLACDALLGQLEPLRKRLTKATAGRNGTGSVHIPFVIVVKSTLVPADKALPLVALKGKQAVTVFENEDLAAFKPIDSVKLPRGEAYLLVDVDTGQESLNVTPDEAMKTLVKQRRSPLTVEEGIALVTHYPEILKTHNCFSLLGSRCGDRRVPALWLSKGHPKLGWCWAGNPHTWLGSASCGGRLGA